MWTHIVHISKTTWVRYVDDILFVTPRDMDIEPKLQSLNAVEPKIQFSIENEIGGKTPVLRYTHNQRRTSRKIQSLPEADFQGGLHTFLFRSSPEI